MSFSSVFDQVPVLIPVETAARELTYKTLLAARLAESGLCCFVGNKSAIGLLIERLNGFVYLDKGFHLGVSEALHKKITEAGGRVVNLDEEGAVDYPDSSSLKTRYASSLFDGTNTVLFWGTSQMSLVEESLGLALKDRVGSSVFLTGHPRFELLKPEYVSLYALEVEQIKKQYGSFILINTNMGFGNNIKGAGHVLDSYRKRFPSIDGMVEFDIEKRSFFVKLVRQLAESSTKRIVFRPHPEEDLGFYRDALSAFDHVDVVFEGSSIPWLLACDHMIHPDCTTAVEMLMLGRKPLSVLPPKATEEFVTTLPVGASIRFESAQQLIDYLGIHDSAESVVDVKEYPFLESYFTYSENAFDAVALAIEKASEAIDTCSNRSLGFIDRIRLLKRERSFRKAKGPGADLIRNKLRGFDRKGVESAFVLRSQLGIREDQVSLRQLSGHLFIIAPKH